MVHHSTLFLNDLKIKFQECCPEDVSNVMPCSETDIASLEEQFSIKFPLAYREFLLWMGQNGGLFLQKQYRYDVLSEINSMAQEIIVRKQPRLFLPHDAFVIGLEMSESFYFIRCNEGSNPKVYVFVDKDEQDYLRGEHKISEFSSEWAFLFDEPKKDFGVLSASLTEYLNYWLDIYVQSKRDAEFWKEERLKRLKGDT